MKIRARRKEGFHHNERVVYALQYEIEPPTDFASACLIVWLNSEGEHPYGFVRHRFGLFFGMGGTGSKMESSVT